MEILSFIALVNTLGDAIVAGQAPRRQCEVFNGALAEGLRENGLPATFCRVENFWFPTDTDPLCTHAICVARPNEQTWSAVDLSSGQIRAQVGQMPSRLMWFGDSFTDLAAQVNITLPGFGLAMQDIGESGFRASFAKNGVPDV